MEILQNNDMDYTYKLLLYYSTLAYLGIDIIDLIRFQKICRDPLIHKGYGLYQQLHELRQ